MTLFVAAVAAVLLVSAMCSLSEAALYAVRTPYVRALAESGSTPGKLLAGFKRNMELPISAILILNTAANTAGAAVAGSQARIIFGEAAVLWFSAAFTLAVLFFSEIIPKILGVVYNRPVARAMSVPIEGLIVVLSPLIWVIRRMSRWLKPKRPLLAAPEEEVKQMAMMSAEEGSILRIEAELVRNVLRLNDVRAREIMTPRPVVFKLPNSMTLGEVAEQVKEWTFSRIPVYSPDDPDTWTGFVLTRDILNGLANDRFEVTLDTLATPIFFVTEQTPGHVLLKEFLRRRTHLFGVVDEYGDIAGVITLEDVMESLIGEEIVDEVDTAVDLQEVARIRHRRQMDRSRREGGREG